MNRGTQRQPLLITGGAGYIGSHLCVGALQAGYEIVVLDNLSNSHRAALAAVERITQRSLTFVEGDVRDTNLLQELFGRHAFQAVVHLAALKTVSKSLQAPLTYYDNNVTGSLRLLEAMRDHNVRRMVFSSSATVYGQAEQMPIDETHPTKVLNPYGRSKLMVEALLQDLAATDPAWHTTVLRYFNPVGAHPSGELGEDPAEHPGNLMPHVSAVAAGREACLNVYGNDYATPDGTGVRDFIHVQDLVNGHLQALARLDEQPGFEIFNLGTGTGYSVLDVVRAFEQVSARKIEMRFAPRRAGDLGQIYADPAKAQRALNWRAEHGLERMCADVWRWQQRYPEGFAGAQ